jgi:hypothetical protein
MATPMSRDLPSWRRYGSLERADNQISKSGVDRGRLVSVPVSVHQPVPDRTQAVWLDSHRT